MRVRDNKCPQRRPLMGLFNRESSEIYYIFKRKIQVCEKFIRARLYTAARRIRFVSEKTRYSLSRARTRTKFSGALSARPIRLIGLLCKLSRGLVKVRCFSFCRGHIFAVGNFTRIQEESSRYTRGSCNWEFIRSLLFYLFVWSICACYMRGDLSCARVRLFGENRCTFICI